MTENINPDVQQSLAALVRAGCDEQVLNQHIEAVKNADPSPSQIEIRGGEKREIRARLKCIRGAAKDIRSLAATFAGEMLGLFLKKHAALPAELEDFANGFENVAERVRLVDLDVGLLTLAGYVLYATGTHHDKEVAGLLGEQDTGTYQHWRRRHKKLVELFRNEVAQNPRYTDSKQ